MKSVLKRLCISAVAGGLLAGVSIGTSADELSDRIAAGEPIRLGFATAIPWAYPGENGEALGFVNALTLVVLEEMGITKHETSVNEWAGLIPGLQADRYDIITGGMYTSSRAGARTSISVIPSDCSATRSWCPPETRWTSTPTRTSSKRARSS